MLLADSLTVYFVQDARSQRDAHYEEDRDPRVPPYPSLSICCPMCHANPNEVCETASGDALELVHIA
jgi:hypothetical protein